MSNNKQSSVEKMFQEMLGIQQEGIKLTFDENLLLLEKYKAMHEQEIMNSFVMGLRNWDSELMPEDYYNETFNQQQND